MLHAITHASLLDDVFREDTVTNDLERYVADLTGHEAALLVVSGTMGNQLSIRTHLTQPPQSVVADKGSHIMHWYSSSRAYLPLRRRRRRRRRRRCRRPPLPPLPLLPPLAISLPPLFYSLFPKKDLVNQDCLT